jgi:chromosome segregation ATPase
MAKQLGKRTVGELEDELKARDRRIEGLREEIDELRDLVTRLRESIEDADNVLESWTEALGMEMSEDGKWTWKPFWNEHNKMIDDYNDLVRQWNKNVP